MRIHTTAKLSEHIERTPEGYLFCPGVAVARTGVMRYLPEEVAPEICEGFDGDWVFIRRDASEVFCPRTLASFEGKPLTLDHPDEDVSPENWSELARGLLFNVRRGDPGRSEADDLMLADILITDAEAIEAVNDGLRELSCGYDADFEVIRPGVGRQINILGNHVALVDHGRAGARCKIKDRENPMAEKKNGKPGWADRLRRLLKDAEAEESAGARDGDNPPAQEGEGQPVTATDDDLAASLEEIKLMLRTLVEALKPRQNADEDPARDEDGPTCDEEPAQDEDAPSRDEESAHDEDEPPNRTTDRRPRRLADADTVRDARRMGLLGCRRGDSADAVRRSALALACRDADARRVVDGILGNKTLARAGTAEIRAAFMAVSALTAANNNRRTTDSLSRPGNGARKPFTPADINRLNTEFYKGGK
ncbi:hypothetical protein HMPREF1022_02287 [Desulfovibrio sp. 6_1_46AFAA]|uniref:DUF2213 domain-containing protein n=1 Tax=Desulfovibrio sp. 6_1_46AFAA TaxID=665942 RepID=UPI0002236D1F|nr:DUF2213 domain-containing protein [Desulfovibrio sp. 6_1_46AFAA]EGW50726.1 hypothetical protein HMPREF1022_02287 [Desulfovibrio sp. 6_1_46AFAA]